MQMLLAGISVFLHGLGVLLAVVVAGGQAPSVQAFTEVDRIVAIVDDDPILASEIDRVAALGLLERREDESEGDYRRRVLDRLIEQRLRLHEVNRFGAPEIEPGTVAAELARITQDLGGEAELARRLEAMGMTLPELRELLLVQLQVMTFVSERLRPRVFVDLEDIRSYYDTVLRPQLEERASPDSPAALPRLEEVQEEIRVVLVEQRLDQEIERWTDDLRRQADVIDLLDRELGSLPPLLERRPQ